MQSYKGLNFYYGWSVGFNIEAILGGSGVGFGPKNGGILANCREYFRVQK